MNRVGTHLELLRFFEFSISVANLYFVCDFNLLLPSKSYKYLLLRYVWTALAPGQSTAYPRIFSQKKMPLQIVHETFLLKSIKSCQPCGIYLFEQCPRGTIHSNLQGLDDIRGNWWPRGCRQVDGIQKEVSFPWNNIYSKILKTNSVERQSNLYSTVDIDWGSDKWSVSYESIEQFPLRKVGWQKILIANKCVTS